MKNEMNPGGSVYHNVVITLWCHLLKFTFLPTFKADFFFLAFINRTPQAPAVQTQLQTKYTPPLHTGSIIYVHVPDTTGHPQMSWWVKAVLALHG